MTRLLHFSVKQSALPPNEILKETISDGAQEGEIDPKLLKTLPVTHPEPGDSIFSRRSTKKAIRGGPLSVGTEATER